MTERLVELASSILQSRTSRRGFLVRSAFAGSALAVSPATYLLRPVTAYAAICGCAGSDCDCGSACCDGYTDFCCAITNGVNACPAGSFTGGWWRADGSQFCDGTRYIMDCHAYCTCSECINGICPSCAGSPCRCAQGDCNHRRVNCNEFRYGQCHQEVACAGPVLCRVVSCTPPYLLDPSCGTTVIYDNSTANHLSGCPTNPQPPVSTAVLVGDWNGDGVKTPGIFRDGTWYLRNSNSTGAADLVFRYGDPGDVPIVGDWNGDGTDTPGIFRDGTWYLRNSNTTGVADVTFLYGDAGDEPIVGDWNGDGTDTPGVHRGRTWYLRNSNSTGVANLTFDYGDPGDVPVIGDWNGDGTDTPGIFRYGSWYLRNSNSTGVAETSFGYGDPSDHPSDR